MVQYLNYNCVTVSFKIFGKEYLTVHAPGIQYGWKIVLLYFIIVFFI